ncbi:MAG: hypothetical protein H0W33_11915 [Gammaproteobacteria bacterium]|nr:hypothetical protein [Gammaproteobacteria bacterium]
MNQEPRETEFERIAPIDLDAHDGPRRPLARRSRRTLPGALLAGLFGLLLIALAGVFFYLPGTIDTPTSRIARVDNVPARSDGGGSPAPARAARTQDVAPWQQALIARERKAAQDILGELLRKQFELEAQGVERWAAEDFATAKARAEAGDAMFRSHQYEAAAAEYTAGNRQLDVLLDRIAPTLAATLDSGDAGLASRNGSAAAEAYELALAIDADNSRALHGLERAASLDEVLALMRSGVEHEQSGRLAEAGGDFREAVELDSEFVDAREALARVDARINDTMFNETMSAGFAALQREDYAGARTAFTQARRLAPSAPGPADGLAQVDLNIRLGQIARHREQAMALEAEERWREAADEYEAALALDADLAFAQAGLRRSLARTDLSERLEFYLSSPERLSSENVHANARALVQQLSLMPARGPRLEQQITRLGELLTLAVTPVRVRLESDNQTQVVMHKVGTLGAFESRELELRPGTYTVVGSCAGYRDVRREVEVAAGDSPAPVVVRCEDKI